MRYARLTLPVLEPESNQSALIPPVALAHILVEAPITCFIASTKTRLPQPRYPHA